jgi:trimethylamine--corrinoid protein Co-methyltransferase
VRPTIQAIDEQLILRIIAEAKQILAEVGIEVRGHKLKERLLAHGLPTNETGKRILFPPAVVDAALATAPHTFTLYDRDGNPFTEIGGDKVHFVPGSSGLKVHDHRSDELRAPTTADFVEYIRVADGLEHIAYLATAFSTEDVEAQISDAWRLYLCLTNSKRPVVSGAFTEHGVPRMAEMMALFRRDKADLIARPMAIFTITATGNFRYSEDSSQNIFDCAEWGIPMEIVPVTLMGLIAPVTLVGAAVFHTVDTLAGIVMAQIVKPGTPVLFGGAPAAFHMGEATSPMLAVQALHLDVIYAAIGKYLGLPTQAYMALSDSKFLDAQAGAESFGSGLLAALAGINSVSGPGLLDYVMVFSLPKLIFDNEICGQIHHFVRELVPVDDLPTIDLVRTQLAEEHMITAPHTLQHWQQQLYLPGPVYDRKNRESWEKAGSKPLWQRAVEEVEERLAAYQPLATDAHIGAEMRRLIEAGLLTGRPLPMVAPAPPARASQSEQRRHRRGRRAATER